MALIASWTCAAIGEPPELEKIEDDQARYEAAMAAYGAPVVDIGRTARAVEIDGRLDEAAWQDASRVPVSWQATPIANVPAKFSTTAYIMDDGKTLFVAFDARTDRPGEIRAHLRKRDSLFNDDYVAIAIDTGGDGTRAFQFLANPLGVQGDAVMDQQRGEDFSFDAIFDTAGQINDDGYVVEFAIPLNELPFSLRPGEQQWKVLFSRTHWGGDRHQDMSYPIDRSSSCWLCEFKPARGLHGIEPGRDLQVIPTLTGNAVRERPATGARHTERSNEVDIGIDDFSWGITHGLTLNAAINPDFSNVEADIAQSAVNSSFVLFFPERRPFFLEGADLFSTPINLVNTRNIVDPVYGAKLSGKVGQNVYGLMTSRDRLTTFLLGGPEGSTTAQIDSAHQATALRYRRDLEGGSLVGVSATHRAGDDYRNGVISIDGDYRLTKSNRLTAQFSRSWSENPLQLVENQGLEDSTNDTALRLQYRHNSRHWFWNLQHQEVGSDFSADLGFLNVRNYQQTGGVFGRAHRGGPGSRIRFANLGVQHWDTKLADGGAFQWRGGGLFTSLNLPKDTWLNLNYFEQERMFSGVRFDLANNTVSVRTRPAHGLFLSTNVRFGDQIDVIDVRAADELRIEQRVEYNLNEHVLLRLRHTYQTLDVRAGRILTSHLTDLRVGYEFDLKNSLRLSLIYRNTERNPDLYTSEQQRRVESYDTQLLYTYQVNPRTVFFAGYASDGIGNDQFSGLRQTGDSIFLKLSYAWRL